eukprot:12934898-Prorocentrum_lima.AAC.1
MIEPGGLRGSGPKRAQDHVEVTPMQEIAENFARKCCQLHEMGLLPATEDMAGIAPVTGPQDPQPVEMTWLP